MIKGESEFDNSVERLPGSWVVYAAGILAVDTAVRTAFKAREVVKTIGAKIADLGDVIFQGEVTDRHR